MRLQRRNLLALLINGRDGRGWEPRSKASHSGIHSSSELRVARSGFGNEFTRAKVGRLVHGTRSEVDREHKRQPHHRRAAVFVVLHDTADSPCEPETRKPLVLGRAHALQSA